MSKLDNIFQSKAIIKLQELGTSMQTNKYFSSISGGMMGTMGLILAGSIFTIIATIGDLLGITPQGSAVYNWLQMPYNMTMGVMAIATAFGVGYNFSKNAGVKGEIVNGIVSMIMFLMVCAPVTTYTLEDGSTITALATTYLGGPGIFTALFMPIVVVSIIKFCKDHNVAIKMPDTVPPFLADSFSALIPLVANILLFVGLNTLLENTMGTTIPGAIMGILSIPLGALISTPGMFVLIFIAALFWVMGVHGTGIVYIVLLPPMIEAYQTNAALVAAGQDPVFSPVFLFAAASACGGFGNCLPLAVHCLMAKSDQLKAIGKAGIVPTLFNISEPMHFGVPVMYNPIIAIQFILNTVVTGLLAYVLFAVGFFQPPYIMMLTALPIFLMEFLPSMAWQNLFMCPLAFVVAFIIYAPFVKVYDQTLLKQEEEVREAEAAAAAEA